MIKLFKITSFLEGISYILLLFVGVPIKYIAGNDLVVKFLGMPHGLLFLAYIVLALVIRSKMNWGTRSTLIALIASLIPFGTFYINKNFFEKQHSPYLFLFHQFRPCSAISFAQERNHSSLQNLYLGFIVSMIARKLTATLIG